LRRGERKIMPRINVMYDLEPDYLYEEPRNNYEIKNNKDKKKNVKISERVLDLMISEGLIKKTEDGYVFVGKYEDTLELKKKKH
jgi:hypothetical protein